MPPAVSVVLPSHNPDPKRLDRVLSALKNQSLPAQDWELLVIDNCSDSFPILSSLSSTTRLINEPHLGLSHARQRGFLEAQGEIIVLVDDDNLLSKNYLATARDFLNKHSNIAAIGGPITPEFASPPPQWCEEFFPLLALRDLGQQPLISPAWDPANPNYPEWAPVGAGMVLRTSSAKTWAENLAKKDLLSDRKGKSLSSSGDNDIIFTILRSSNQVAYLPALQLTHIIPPERLDPCYLARLNEGIQHSWVQVLQKYGANPWRPIPAWSVPLRQFKAWIKYRAWAGPAERIRWRGACGAFSALGSIARP